MRDTEYKRWLLKERPSLEMQLLRWIHEATTFERGTREYVSGVQLEENGIRVVLRQYTNRYSDDCLTICAVELPKDLQNRGWFKSFLVLCCQITPWQDVIIEDVKNPHLRGFCQRNGFAVLDDFYPDTFIVNQQKMLSMSVTPLSYFRASG
ncbi:hypothetical protein QPJ96_22210 (plasmid) [Pantoea agglomerans]|nr:hypothetical protein [Pantoea agglomerans]WIL44527.1 hypothetical protein QPJ96_22210 [Pantoea agglomerans]